MRYLLLVYLLVTVFGCISKSEHEKVLKELDDCKNGASKLSAMIDKDYKKKNYKEAKSNILKLEQRHPEAPGNKKYSKLLFVINKMLKAKEAKRRKKEEKKIRIANRNKTGMWEVAHYVDEFGQPTKSGYIRTKSSLYGSFSNSATTDSKLKVGFLFSNHKDMNIQLYEYAGRNPVKAYMSTSYSVLVMDKNKKRYNLSGSIRKNGDRMALGEKNSKKLHSILKKGGKIILIIKKYDSLDEYKLIIENADLYYNAYKKLHGIK